MSLCLSLFHTQISPLHTFSLTHSLTHSLRHTHTYTSHPPTHSPAPGPTLHVRLRDVLFLLPCNAAQENAESNAAGHMGYTANPFPAASLIQFEAPTSNTVCVFRGGDSAGSADGLVVSTNYVLSESGG